MLCLPSLSANVKLSGGGTNIRPLGPRRLGVSFDRRLGSDPEPEPDPVYRQGSIVLNGYTRELLPTWTDGVPIENNVPLPRWSLVNGVIYNNNEHIWPPSQWSNGITVANGNPPWGRENQFYESYGSRPFSTMGSRNGVYGDGTSWPRPPW